MKIMGSSLRNEKGIALVTTLMLLVLGFAVVVTLLRLITAETKLSRLEQSYTTALEAAKSGTDLFLFLIQNGHDSTPAIGGKTPFGTTNAACLSMKMNDKTANWNKPGCENPTDPLHPQIDPDPTVSPDLTLNMLNYNVKLKVVDTTQTDPPASCPSSPPTPIPCCPNGCSYYTVNVRAQAPSTGERAEITFVYQYDR